MSSFCHPVVARHGTLVLLVCVVLLLYCLPPLAWFETLPPASCGDEKIVAKNKTTMATMTESASVSHPSSINYFYDWNTTVDNELIVNNSFHGVQARAFAKWQYPIPCFPPSPLPDKTDQGLGPRKRGLFYLKLVKTGGSTCNGINARIARNVGRRARFAPAQSRATPGPFLFDRCESNFGHSFADELVPNRNRKESFLWSTLRDPTSRALSRFFFFTVSRGKLEPSDAEFQRSNGLNCYHYMRRLTTNWTDAKRKSPAEIANKILQEYDFLGITERMEESTVALSMVLGVPLADVLYVDAKHNGGYDEGTENHNTCTYIVPTFQSNGLKEYFKTREFQDCVRWDNVLYQVANRSLDLTIDKLGRFEFEIKLEKFRAARSMIQTKCKDVVFPCSSGGVKMNKTGCLWQDSGCGFQCLDDVAMELLLW